MFILEENEPELPDPDRKQRARALPAVVLVALAALAVAGTLFFYQYLDHAMFQERQSHFIELSDQVAQVLESVAARYWSVTSSAEDLLELDPPPSEEALSLRLSELQSCLMPTQGLVLAFDSEGQFYASDGHTGQWEDTSLLTNGLERQDLVAELDNASYILFLRALDKPLPVGDARITHAAAVVDLSVFQNTFDADMFQGRSHVYVVGPNGDSVYRHECPGGFIDDYNLLTALERYPFIHGGTLDELRQDLARRSSAGYEFDYGSERYFVAASPVGDTDWMVLTFVPTEVLGAGSASFLNTAVICVSAIAAVVVLMMGILVHFFVAKRSDQRIIAHQKRANDLLQIAADAANAASVAKSDFLSHMSHDIRTPINGIMGMTEIALKHLEEPERVQDCLKKIESSSGHLLSLVNDVLDMSRIESGKTRIAQEPMDMRQMLSHCSAILSGYLQDRELSFIEEFPPLEHPYVLGDELHLRQALINILGNAVKFTPDGGRICFRCRELSLDGDTVWFRLEVEDTGIGMKPEFLPHIFEAFAQEDGGTRTSYKGTGLGMSITKQFIELMDGTIDVKSQVNVGTHFVVELPLLIDRTVQVDEAAESQPADLTGLRLLLAEDNELNMEIAQYILEELGAECVPVADGQAALDTFAASAPGELDGILMDVMMPVMDGLAATRAIRALPRADAATIPIIAMTANAYDEDKRRCLEAGMNAHVAKPINSTVLTQLLVSILYSTPSPVPKDGGNVPPVP